MAAQKTATWHCIWSSVIENLLWRHHGGFAACRHMAMAMQVSHGSNFLYHEMQVWHIDCEKGREAKTTECGNAWETLISYSICLLSCSTLIFSYYSVGLSTKLFNLLKGFGPYPAQCKPYNLTKCCLLAPLKIALLLPLTLSLTPPSLPPPIASLFLFSKLFLFSASLVPKILFFSTSTIIIFWKIYLFFINNNGQWTERFKNIQ